MKELWKNRKLIWKLAKNDFKTRFAGSAMGRVWAFVQPVVTVVMYYCVFGIIFPSRAQVASSGIETPYVLWLTAGLVPWFFFNEAIVNGTNSLIQYNYLVKKVVFKIDILPIIKVLAATFIHAFFAGVLLILYFCYGYKPAFSLLQIPYYSFCLFMLALAISYTTSAVCVFFRDLNQVINIVLQVGMWATPILWNIAIVTERIPSKYFFLNYLFKYNPVFYVVDGYRTAMFENMWFWQNWKETLVFWGLTILFFLIGGQVFKKLRIHFADVL